MILQDNRLKCTLGTILDAVPGRVREVLKSVT